MQPALVPKDEENDAEVRREDQDNINRFARLNARLHIVRDKQGKLKVCIVSCCTVEPSGSSLVARLYLDQQKELESLDDANADLMMQAGGIKILLLKGEAFFETSDEDATTYCETQIESLQEKVDALVEEEGIILTEQEKLKVSLYGRFGKSINLEDDPKDAGVR